MNPFKVWMQKSTLEQKQKLAELADSSVPSLRLAAQGYRTAGEPDLTAEFAGRIAEGTEKFEGLPVVKREDLCKACAECPYQKQCNSK